MRPSRSSTRKRRLERTGPSECEPRVQALGGFSIREPPSSVESCDVSPSPCRLQYLARNRPRLSRWPRFCEARFLGVGIARTPALTRARTSIELERVGNVCMSDVRRHPPPGLLVCVWAITRDADADVRRAEAWMWRMAAAWSVRASDFVAQNGSPLAEAVVVHLKSPTFSALNLSERPPRNKPSVCTSVRTSVRALRLKRTQARRRRCCGGSMPTSCRAGCGPSLCGCVRIEPGREGACSEPIGASALPGAIPSRPLCKCHTEYCYAADDGLSICTADVARA